MFLFELVSPKVLPALITKIEPINLNIKYKIKNILNYKKIKKYIKYLIK